MDNSYLQKLYEMYSEMYEDWLLAIENYRTTYERQSGTKANEKLITAFCKLRRIPYPLPNKEEFISKTLEKHNEVNR